MTILGVDHGAKTGIALVKDENIRFVGTVNIDGVSKGEKLKMFYNKLRFFINSYNPSVIVLERPNHRRNAATTTILDGYYCVACMAAHENRIQTIEAYPSTVKKTIAGNGHATKDEVAQAISKEYKIPLDEILQYDYYKINCKGGNKGDVKTIHYDKSDALALALYGMKEKSLSK